MALVNKTVGKDGRKQVTGVKSALVASQLGPYLYGHFHVGLALRWLT